MSGIERFGPLVRRDEWAETESLRIDAALKYATEMSFENPQEHPDRPGWWWTDRFDASIEAGYPEWEWERRPQLGLAEFGGVCHV